MTYCVGILVREGLAMLADTRTNAGVDNISTYRKLRLFGNDGERLIMIASAGSLSTTQAALQRLNHGILHPETGQLETLANVPDIFSAALAAGRAIRTSRDALEGLAQADINFNTTFLVGGSIKGEPTRLFLVYGAGNAIECHPDTPYLQIGENKYGKPILDRALDYDAPLSEAVKLALISFDSTIRSNLAVGLPIDIAVAADRQGTAITRRIDADDPYFTDLSHRWSTALSSALATIPTPPYAEAGAPA